MSFDDYAKHIYQKHRLCIALVIIKIKPPNLSTQEYIKQLSSKMADVMDVEDVTICSEDFMADYDESFNVLRDFEEIDERHGVVMRNNKHSKDVQTTSSIPENLTHTTYYSQSQQITKNIKTIDNNTTDYVNEENAFHTKEKTVKSPDKYSDLNIITTKDLSSTGISNIDELSEEDCIKTQPIKITKTAEKSNSDKYLFNKETNFKDLENNTVYDSQKTIPYTLYGFTQNDSHYSQSQSQMYIPNKYLYALKNKNGEENISNVNAKNNTNINTQPNNANEKYETDISKENYIYEENVLNENLGNNSQNNEMDTTSILNTQFTIASKNSDENSFANNILENSLTINDYFNEIHSFNDNTDLRNKPNLETHKTFSQNSNFNQNNVSYFNTQMDLNTYVSLKTENKIKQFDALRNNIASSQNVERKTFFSSFKSNIKDVDIEINKTNTTEFIPYKVLEELNKVKIYLRRKGRRVSTEGYSTDSGYKSDSQARSFNKNSLQSSGICINQSAYCLFNHILRCPLVAATRDITSEIAQTLADLIDRLHDDETYPPFLEELLDTVDILIRQVYKARNTSESEFLNKDEFMQRALLLNKSIHIQKHCIEKITNILVKFHEKVTDNNVIYELTNLDEIENISYIFHILEILIKKYMKYKNLLSQTSTQPSQDEDKILKRSSIADIWRRKWNTNIPETSEGSRENRCVLKNCSEILNKIIVDCMNMYSLVAFSALKCFNTMQS